MFTLQARLSLSCQGQTASVVVLWGPEVLSTSLWEAGGARLTVTTSACQGLKPNGLALEGLISLLPGWTKRNLRNDEAHSLLLLDLSYLISPNLQTKQTTANLPCLEATNALGSHTPSSSLLLPLL